MALELYVHPFSSYSWKALVAFFENDVEFHYRNLEDPAAAAEWVRLWPVKKFPILADGDRTILEATSIIEYLAVHRPGPVKLIPADADAAIEARMMDRVFDNYVMTPMQKIVADAIRPEGAKDSHGVEEAKALLDTVYAWLDERMETRAWAAGPDFTLADCAAAGSLFYADWVREIPRECGALRAYRSRLLQRPSVARCVDEARPYRHYFPLGAPDRD